LYTEATIKTPKKQRTSGKFDQEDTALTLLWWHKNHQLCVSDPLMLNFIFIFLIHEKTINWNTIWTQYKCVLLHAAIQASH
jgi:hypothetical protein